MIIEIAKVNETFQGVNNKSQLFILLINVRMATIVSILTFIRRINFMLSRVEHEKSLISPGPGCRN